MKITYAICVCNEHEELNRLLSFLKDVKHEDDDINILIDTKNVTTSVKLVLEEFSKDITTCERDFDNNFGAHRNFQFTQCTGHYIFIIDGDEIPRVQLVKNMRNIINQSGADCIAVPRINIISDITDKYNQICKFNINEQGWINWPDFSFRLFKNNKNIKYEKQKLHEVLSGFEKGCSVAAKPLLAIWHIKNIKRQMKQHDLYESIAGR